MIRLIIFLIMAALSPARALDLTPLAGKSFADTEKAVLALQAAGDANAARALEALAAGKLAQRKPDASIFIVEPDGDALALFDPVSGEPHGKAEKTAIERIKINNKLRRVIRAAIGGLTLLSPNRAIRLSAARSVFHARDPDSLETLDQALAQEKDPEIAKTIREARAAVILAGDAPEETKLAAVAVLRERGDREALAVLSPLTLPAARIAVADIESRLARWAVLQNVYYGVSLGSVLLLAAIGLAVTFGVMGVINMAHGEMVMLGAYSTFIVQETIRVNAPELFDFSLLIALPLAFLIAGLMGLIIERGVIRFLYGRPLETLLATWGVSLILQQGVRSLFGPSNREVGNPSFMSGAFDLGGLTLTYNRMWIIVFALALFVVITIVLRATRFGLFLRAVTQNRRMAASMGVRTPWVDALTFGLGSGIAGLAGVALSQIDNVSPNLGQAYIIDSFMVVVFGGVGNLWGALVGAMGIGIANKLVEPYAGAVLGKIAILVGIILFIQKRPRGLFPLKGRAAET